MVEMKVHIVAIDAVSMYPIVILTDEKEEEFFPLVVGPAEASAISLELQGIVPPRPLTHDLLFSMITSLEAEVSRVVITDVVDETYYASIFLKVKGKELEIDARPSDSIALAIRAVAPIYVVPQVLDSAVMREASEDKEKEAFKRFLDTVSPEDFGKSN